MTTTPLRFIHSYDAKGWHVVRDETGKILYSHHLGGCAQCGHGETYPIIPISKA